MHAFHKFCHIWESETYQTWCELIMRCYARLMERNVGLINTGERYQVSKIS